MKVIVEISQSVQDSILAMYPNLSKDDVFNLFACGNVEPIINEHEFPWHDKGILRINRDYWLRIPSHIADHYDIPWDIEIKAPENEAIYSWKNV